MRRYKPEDGETQAAMLVLAYLVHLMGDDVTVTKKDSEAIQGNILRVDLDMEKERIRIFLKDDKEN